MPASLVPCFPRRSGELFPIQRSSIVDVWISKPSGFRGFPSFEIDFYIWYSRMKSGVGILFGKRPASTLLSNLAVSAGI